MSGNGGMPSSAMAPPGALPVTLLLDGNPVHIGWVLTLCDLPELLDSLAATLREMTEEARRQDGAT